MIVSEAHNKVLFTVASGGSEHRAVQLVERTADENIYASTVIKVGDQVLVAEVPGLLSGPNMDDPADAVSHLIVGLVPPSKWHEMSSYSDLVI